MYLVMPLIYIKNNEENGGNSNKVTDRYWPFIIWEWSSRRTVLYISIYVYEIWPCGILCRWHLKIFKRHMPILQIFDLSHTYFELLILTNCFYLYLNRSKIVTEVLQSAKSVRSPARKIEYTLQRRSLFQVSNHSQGNLFC